MILFGPRSVLKAIRRFIASPLTFGEKGPSGAGFRQAEVDPRNYKLDARLLKRIWRVAKPYWVRKGPWPSYVAFVVLISLPFGVTGLWAYSTEVLKNLTNAIVDKEANLFWSLLVVWGAILFGRNLLLLLQVLVDELLMLDWRRWLTRHLMGRYLRRRTYYNIELRGDIDNPDQRIQEEPTPFTEAVARLPRILFNHTLEIGVGAAIIVSISPGLLWFVIAYMVTFATVTYFMYIPTIRQNFESTVAEADLRYGILHVRDNAETVAFYGGEQAEDRQIDSRLITAIKRAAKVLYYRIFITVIKSLFSFSWQVAPYALLVPLFFAGDIEYGSIAQAIVAAEAMSRALTLLTQAIPAIASAGPSAVRLAEIIERFDQMDSVYEDTSRSRIKRETGDTIELTNVSIRTPGDEIQLAKDLSLSIDSGKHTLIVGQTGVGKSSLLRALAGLWTRGDGKLTMPASSKCLFLPQKPYMILGTLRDQLLYPHGSRAEISDAELQSVLERTALPDLLEKHDGLDTSRDWAKVLSLGEQQRIGFARILMSDPEFVFLDEATSAVDKETEETLYELLQGSGATCISVAHRDSVRKFHKQTLELFPGGTWSLTKI